MKPGIVLCMIVRDEAAVIERALRSAIPHVDAVVVVDTGSVDGTQDIVRRMADILPGEVFETPWVDFASARNVALAHASAYGTHALFLDADDELVASSALVPTLVADVYDGGVDHGGITYTRPLLVRMDPSVYWRGVVHEYLKLPGDYVRARTSWRVRIGGGGNRSRDPLKYLHDADRINEALKVEQDPMLRNRYCFYLAQSYRDASHSGAAIYWYEVALKSHGWSEERYIAALNLGRLTGRRFWFAHAYDINPDRAEALRGLGLDRLADRCEIDPSWLFVETAAYRST